ncbi:hypothetical protein MtrunA17_Chr3g0130771 [Medicago truncatula]|uniref:Uncharacterized protein n=1 Tax=Medicago truncatula TaxID=3880 RepID=A0A396J0V2_MEDTR|nr:hypothetical protein MtrunA17_Chr3g0130771 [Medicago truncatula]
MCSWSSTIQELAGMTCMKGVTTTVPKGISSQEHKRQKLQGSKVNHNHDHIHMCVCE